MERSELYHPQEEKLWWLLERWRPGEKWHGTLCEKISLKSEVEIKDATGCICKTGLRNWLRMCVWRGWSLLSLWCCRPVTCRKGTLQVSQACLSDPFRTRSSCSHPATALRASVELHTLLPTGLTAAVRGVSVRKDSLVKNFLHCFLGMRPYLKSRVKVPHILRDRCQWHLP